jgi:hypothetical protein
MSGGEKVSYVLDFKGSARRKAGEDSADRVIPEGEDHPIPRIARLLALAIRFEGLLRDRTIRDYADLARLGGVSRARITQIMKLRLLAPDIQEQILFLSDARGVTERNLRPLPRRIDWTEQRRMFQAIARSKGNTR